MTTVQPSLNDIIRNYLVSNHCIITLKNRQLNGIFTPITRKDEYGILPIYEKEKGIITKWYFYDSHEKIICSVLQNEILKIEKIN